MNERPNSITFRTELRSGDIGHITERHGLLYSQEYGYGIGFESYVAAGLHEFYSKYDPTKNRIWIAEDEGKMIGSILLIDRGSEAQLRYFFLEPDYRGKGLGKELMARCMQFARECNYRSVYLWTTSELHAAAKLYTAFGFQLAEEHPSGSFGKPVIEQRYIATL